MGEGGGVTAIIEGRGEGEIRNSDDDKNNDEEDFQVEDGVSRTMEMTQMTIPKMRGLFDCYTRISGKMIPKMIPVMTRRVNTNRKGQRIPKTTTTMRLTATGPPRAKRRMKMTDNQDHPSKRVRTESQFYFWLNAPGGG